VCTFALAWRTLADRPVAVAANRDEAVDRPAAPPTRWRVDGTSVVAPRDDRAGGTWLGHNEAGVVVGLTNLWGVAREGERSRGLLVRDALGTRSAAAAVERVERAVARDDYAGFALVAADGDRAALVEWDGTLAVRDLPPGVSVVVNVGAALPDGDRFREPAGDAPDAGRWRAQAADARRLRARLTPGDDETAARWLDRAGAALGDHETGACVHGDGFGTRSSSLVVPGERYRFADGPPCETPYRTVDEQV
jgi:hypothetical protein